MERKSNKLLITRWNGQILTALTEDGKCRSLNLEPADSRGILGNIYIGKVKNVVKNINSAFVDLGSGQIGYYSLKENKRHLFTDEIAAAQAGNRKKTEGEENGTEEGWMKKSDGFPVREKERLPKAGDEIIVQVERDAVKTKDPVLTSNLNFTGKYLVLTLGKNQIGFSGKIRDGAWKESLKKILKEKKDDSFGIIVRTNAREADIQSILRELELLKERKSRLFATAGWRTCYSLLSSSEPSYVNSIRDTYAENLEAIVTDDRDCYDALRTYMEENQREDLEKLSFYEDTMVPLAKLYSLDTAMEQALGKHVWLKSGGYLVIEPTEALTVIDVNTGKYAGKKTQAETILRINREAAVEIARQMQLRNLSGIIIVDFIDMDADEDKKELMRLLELELLRDPVKTVLVEMTKLGLVEITRKKIRRPLAEQVRELRSRQQLKEKN